MHVRLIASPAHEPVNALARHYESLIMAELVVIGCPSGKRLAAPQQPTTSQAGGPGHPEEEKRGKQS